MQVPKNFPTFPREELIRIIHELLASVENLEAELARLKKSLPSLK